MISPRSLLLPLDLHIRLTALSDGETVSSGVLRVASTRLGKMDKSRCSVWSVLLNLARRKNRVKHVHGCNCGLLAESFAKTQCLCHVNSCECD